jgi:hypothetical protein
MEQEYYHMTIAGCERDLPLCPLTDELMIAGFVIFGDPEITTACAKELLARAPEYDYILTAEAKGIPLAHEMARLAGNQRYILARKAPKLYMTGVTEVTVRSITTAKEQKLYLKLPDKNGEVFTKVMSIISIFGGRTPVIIYNEKEKKYEKCSTGVDIRPNMLAYLRKLLGEGGVVLK